MSANAQAGAARVPDPEGMPVLGFDEMPMQATSVESAPGYVDFFGLSIAAGGWLFCGWVPRPFRTSHLEPVDFLAQFDQSRSKGRATLVFYQREDLGQKGLGVIAFLPCNSRVVGLLQYIAFAVDGVMYHACAGPSTACLSAHELVARVRPDLANRAFANRNREHLLSIISRREFSGQDTLASLSETVLIEIDEAIACPPDGVLLKGWQLSAPAKVRSIRLRSGLKSAELVLADSICITRPDVIAAVGPKWGFCEVRCGFVAFLPGALSPGEACYLEVELHDGEVGFKPVRLSGRAGLNAIRGVLDGIEARYGELAPAFDKVLGPAIASINTARLRDTCAVTGIHFGRVPDTPKCSLIIPLYGRVDFLEYQLALFSRHPGTRALDILYVLDDPARQRELEDLAHSAFERFRIPFQLLLLSRNLGFGPASNVGLQRARGEFICFLNSDILPLTADWNERLVGRLEQDCGIGVIGPLLLFEDGSVQHEGCCYRRLPDLGDWTFVEHVNKGRRPQGSRGLRECEAITGACMVMQRSLALELGGFDEDYIVGDFEDSDLCLRVRSRGLACALDDTVELYHLERKSQTAPNQSWRMNLTLYNAWRHERRWSTLLRAGAAPTAGAR